MKSTYAKVVIFVTMGLWVFSLGVGAAGKKTGSKTVAQASAYQGDIVDGMCLQANKSDLKQFVSTHKKECVLAPQCRDTGMYLYQPNGTVLQFDKESSGRIVTFLEKKDSKLQVALDATKNADGTYHLVSIKNR